MPALDCQNIGRFLFQGYESGVNNDILIGLIGGNYTALLDLGFLTRPTDNLCRSLSSCAEAIGSRGRIFFDPAKCVSNNNTYISLLLTPPPVVMSIITLEGKALCG